jgi:hypothetical protein
MRVVAGLSRAARTCFGFVLPEHQTLVDFQTTRTLVWVRSAKAAGGGLDRPNLVGSVCQNPDTGRFSDNPNLVWFGLRRRAAWSVSDRPNRVWFALPQPEPCWVRSVKTRAPVDFQTSRAWFGSVCQRRRAPNPPRAVRTWLGSFCQGSRKLSLLWAAEPGWVRSAKQAAASLTLDRTNRVWFVCQDASGA